MMVDIGILGMGRMGRGIAEAYAFAGKRVLMIDVKPCRLRARPSATAMSCRR
jgi:3-hydroxyacyl-CoA dehydrogenase